MIATFGCAWSLKSNPRPREKGCSERLEVFGRNIAYGNPAAIFGSFLVSLNSRKTAGTRALKRSRRAERCRAHARNAFQTMKDS